MSDHAAMYPVETEHNTQLTRSDVFDYISEFSFVQPGRDFFQEKPKRTVVRHTDQFGTRFPVFINEFWTSRQRQACSLHEIAYRGCFKPQLPRFFVRILSKPGDTVYDPFAGRGTTIIESGLMGREVISNDINPLSRILTRPRFFPPVGAELDDRLSEIPVNDKASSDIDISMFYHRKTEAELVSLRKYLLEKDANDHIDNWIRMIATNRLTGHSPGFFSVYTLPPNQAVQPENQIKINKKRKQVPEYRNVKGLIRKKSGSLLRNVRSEVVYRLQKTGSKAKFLTLDARTTREIPSDSVQVTITSPPFLDVIQYSADNWLRCWFNGISPEIVGNQITVCKNIESWTNIMQDVLLELFRITRPRGWVAFEVGEVRNGKIKLEENIIPLGQIAGFDCCGVLINEQRFTKTANIWGVNNNNKGTNTNRIVLFYKGA